METKGVVLQKYISMCGFASRRKAEEMIASGEVKVGECTASLGMRVIPGKDAVTVNGNKLTYNVSEKYYIMLNKPRGYVTTMSDENGRKCVADLVKDIPARVYPAGRLDKDSEGLLIMTNDGDFANKLIHPSHDIWKTYRVTVRSAVTENQLTMLCIGPEIDGKPTVPARVEIIFKDKDRTVLEFSIKEGRNRQIRKMCELVGLDVSRLKRISVGYLRLGMLPPGKWKALTSEEVRASVNF